jgi:hypothetical protein
MSARWSVTIWHALADFDGAEQEFLLTLWDDVFSPLQGLENYELEDELRERFHRDQKLVGTSSDWSSVYATEWKGQRYITAASAASPCVIPPFPQKFGDDHWMSRRIPLPSVWHVLFAAEDREVREKEIFVPLESARRNYSDAFLGISALIYWADNRPEEFRQATPRFSDGWQIIRKLLTLFDAVEYMEVLRIISRGYGGHAVLELNFAQQIDTSDPPSKQERRARFLEENANLNRILHSARDHDLTALARAVPSRVDYTDDFHSIMRWVSYFDRDFASPFVRAILTEDELKRSIASTLGGRP